MPSRFINGSCLWHCDPQCASHFGREIVRIQGIVRVANSPEVQRISERAEGDHVQPVAFCDRHFSQERARFTGQETPPHVTNLTAIRHDEPGRFERVIAAGVFEHDQNSLTSPPRTAPALLTLPIVAKTSFTIWCARKMW